MKKKKRRSISLSARAAIAFSMLCLLSLIAWRDVAIYIGAKCGNTAIITEECIKIQESAVADIYGNRSYRPLYELKLRNGTSVAIYQEETTKFFLVRRGTGAMLRDWPVDHIHLRPKTSIQR